MEPILFGEGSRLLGWNREWRAGMHEYTLTKLSNQNIDVWMRLIMIFCCEKNEMKLIEIKFIEN